MKQLTLFCLLGLAALISVCAASENKSSMVNPILGDISFVKRFGHAPDATTNNELRISTHLEYVEQLLRRKDVSRLSAQEQTRRLHMLDLLSAYRKAGNFPKNYDYPGRRKPCFIDADKTICAVGYLVEQTAGRAAAERINNEFQYEELLAMNDEGLNSWIASSGLTREECAMIQPSYGYYGSENNLSPAYASATGVLGGTNLALGAISCAQLSRGTGSRVVPAIGLFTGAGQVVLGAAMMPDKSSRNESQKTVSMINIGMGSAAMILSAINLLSANPAKEKRTAWNMFSFPTPGNKAGLGFSMTRRF